MLKLTGENTPKIPRYTSYPTVPHFHAGITAADYQDWLGQIPPKTCSSLYLHVPFCRKLCWFCGCHTKIVNSYDPVAHYLGLLRREIDLIARHSPVLDIHHVHFGGGSPSMLTPDDFCALLDQLRQRFDFYDKAEIAIELDPRDISKAKVAAYAKAGVTRASIGVQDFNACVQKAINRVQKVDEVYRVVQMLREHGINGINIDLVYGLPQQTPDKLLNTIDLALTLQPDRIALFGYAHVPWMMKHQQLIDETTLPDSETRLAMAGQACHALRDRGYQSIGLDHFAKADDSLIQALKTQKMQRNFQGYSSDPAEVLLGLGHSAISSLAPGYVQNTIVPGDYERALSEDSLPIMRGIAITADDRLRRDIISALMCYLRVDLDAVSILHDRPGIDFSRELAALVPFEKQNMVRIAGKTIEVTESGRSGLRLIAAVFDTYLAGQDQQYSSAV